MPKIAIVTDSTAYLSQEIIDRYGIHVVPLSVNFGNQTLKEGKDISTAEFYQRLRESDQLPTTSQPAIGDFIALYERLAKDYDQAIAIHLSSGISGTMNTSQSAARMVEGIEVVVLDSESACYGLGFMVIEAAKMVEEGKKLEEIVERIQWMVGNLRAYFVVDDLSYLHRGGRLNAAQFLIGSMLKIKPIIYFENKKLEPFEKIRTKKKAIDRILQLLDQDARDGTPIRLSVVHADVIDEANELLEKIERTYPNIEGDISDFGPVIGAHTGPGTIGIAWYKK
ncbi:DegV family protein [Tepidibacillus fermentans]|uniref:DegV family protein with EDD domain n=1 Tax=Tepidibacillus fermentans TaxID=1281767 RepID=A0A4R3KIL3_9BACI|nr:DegV family protein [Tepidibacillus fermentans]TCS83329.1 DegV family protein with EDD domain [Tepidibacillus fermentans]